MGEDSERGRRHVAPGAARFPELSRRVQLWPCNIKPPQPKQDRTSWRLAHLLTQRACLGVGVLHLGAACLRHLQCRAEGDVQGQCLLGTLRRLWQGLEQLDAGGQVADGFQMAERSLACCRPLPGHRLLGAACGGVVLGHQLGLGLDGLGEACLQELRHLLVHLLPRAPQQRGIGGILDQGMLEHILARRPPPLVEQFGRHQPGQPVLHRGLVLRRDGHEHVVGELPAEDAPSCATSLAVVS